MLDLILVALESDSTRVATFMLGNAASGRSYDFIGVSGGHHALSHHQGKEENFEKLIKIDTWEVEQLSYLLERMNVRREDGSRLLNDSAVFFSSEIEDGNTHAHHNLPVLLAGQLGGFLPTGCHTRVPERTPLSRLFLTLQQGVGVAAKRFGVTVTSRSNPAVWARDSELQKRTCSQAYSLSSARTPPFSSRSS